MITKKELANGFYDTATLYQEILGLVEGQVDLLILALKDKRAIRVEDGLNVLSLMIQGLQTTADLIVEEAEQKLKQVREE